MTKTLLLMLAACHAEPAAIEPLPATLAETGIDDPGVRTFAPQYPLWTDGAKKQRRIYLPSAIDATDANAWEFPVGTKLWKQFAFGGVVAETRMMERTAQGWRYVAYDANGATAPRGARSIEIAPGVRHAIPSEADCRICHTNGPLGFSALQLSSDRDPDAAHKEAAGELDLTALRDANLLRNDRGPAVPRIAGRTPHERAALGYLHANCGGCHNPRTALASVGLALANGDVMASVLRPSRIVPDRMRVAPGQPGASVVVDRMRSRSPVMQMPPLGTQLVDDEGVELVSAWIAELSQVSPTNGTENHR